MRHTESITESAREQFDDLDVDEKFLRLPARLQLPAVIDRALEEFNEGYLSDDDAPADRDDARFVGWYVRQHEDEARACFIMQAINRAAYCGV